jgi:uncharacterized RDD family membrane protein YckC
MYRPVAILGTQREVVDRRALAFLVDVALLATLVGVVTVASEASGFVAAVLFAVGAFGYFSYMEGTYGQTVGKRLVGVVVVKTDGSRCDGRSAVVRTFGRLVDVLPFVYVVDGAAGYYLDRDRRRVSDVIADTLVVAVAPPVVLETTETPRARTA